MGIARRIAEALGPSSWVVRRANPVREVVLRGLYGRTGVRRTVNAVPMRVLPEHRASFTPEYDPAVAAYFRGRIRPGAVCLNVGANLGLYALQFAHWAGPAGVVVAFEPNPAAAAVLRRHVAINRLAGRVRVVERAVADRPGTATFYAAGVDGMSRLGGPNPALRGPSRAVAVAVETLDEFCARERVQPEAVMIDVEGFEAAVLAGAAGLFAGDHPPAAVVEMHPQAWAVAGTDRAAVERLLDGYRLRAVPLSGQRDPLGEYGHVALEPNSP